MPLPEVGDIFKELVWDAMKKAALAALFKAVPFLGWGPVGILVGWIGGMVADYLYDSVKMAIDLRVIVFKNEEHRKAFDDAGVKLKIIASGKGLASAEYKEARDAHKAALAKFVRIA